jgi:membrane protein implicated in regulation of membrane protease activity
MMFDFQNLGRFLLVIGGGIALIGLLLLLGGRFLPWLGRLPGDIRYEGKSVSCFFPIVTSILLSLILTLVLNIILALIRRGPR